MDSLFARPLRSSDSPCAATASWASTTATCAPSRPTWAPTVRLAELVEDKQILVSESGIRDKADVQRMQAAGVRSLLIGETLMKSGDVGGTMANLKGIFRRA